MMNLVAGLIGIAVLIGFLGTLIWWIKALPLTIIAVATVILLIVDFVRTMRAGGQSGL
jgi:hypothetical protein